MTAKTTAGDAQWLHPWPVDEHCWYHDAHEPIDGSEHEVCPECWHAFRTEAEILAAHNRIIDEMNAYRGMLTGEDTPTPHETDAAQIVHCPYCAHDL